MMKSNIRNIGLLLLLGVGTLGTMGTANAHDHDFFGFSLNLGGPAYYAPPDAYYDARPVYIEQRPRVVYYDQPVERYGYYGGQAYYQDERHEHHERNHGYGHYRHQHEHDDDD